MRKENWSKGSTKSAIAGKVGRFWDSTLRLKTVNKSFLIKSAGKIRPEFENVFIIHYQDNLKNASFIKQRTVE